MCVLEQSASIDTADQTEIDPFADSELSDFNETDIQDIENLSHTGTEKEVDFKEFEAVLKEQIF